MRAAPRRAVLLLPLAALPRAAQAADSDVVAPISALNAALLGAMRAGNTPFPQRYAALLQTGMFAAVYLSVGLGRTSEV